MAQYALGPENGSLRVLTTRAGVAAKVGHDLVIEVGSWSATVSDEPLHIELEADSTSLTILEGTGGVKPLSDKDRGEIKKNIDAKILKGQPIRYTGAATGELQLVGQWQPVTLDLNITDGAYSGSVTVTQSRWGIKPYSGLMGALKVADDVTITVSGQLP